MQKAVQHRDAENCMEQHTPKITTACSSVQTVASNKWAIQDLVCFVPITVLRRPSRLAACILPYVSRGKSPSPGGSYGKNAAPHRRTFFSSVPSLLAMARLLIPRAATLVKFGIIRAKSIDIYFAIIRLRFTQERQSAAVARNKWVASLGLNKKPLPLNLTRRIQLLQISMW